MRVRPKFLDFLLGASLPDRQKFYRSGLDELQSRAKKEFNKPFADLDASQADAILRPLLVPVPWPDDPPRDLGQHFLSVAHQDIRTATMNSREWNLAAAASASRSHDGGVGEYWYPIEPLYSIQPPSVK